MVSINLSIGRTVRAAWWPAGATWAADFATGRYMVAGSPVTADAAFTLLRASAKLAPDSTGRLTSFASNLPALTDLGLLLEPAATNLCTWSSELTDSSWVKNSCALTTGQPDPTGASGATLIEEQSSGALLRRQSNLTVTSGETYTVSIFVRRFNTDWCRLIVGDSTGLSNAAWTWFNLQTGVKGSSGNGGTGFGYQSHRCEILGNYLRISVTVLAPSATMNVGLVTASGDGQTSRANVGGGPGLGGGVIVWSAQFEVGATATSAIVTGSTTAIRAADILQLATASGQSVTVTFADGISQVVSAPTGPFTVPMPLNRSQVRSIVAQPA